MNAGEYMAILTEHAKAYRPGAEASIKRNGHMNDVTPQQRIEPSIIDAVLVDFINHVGRGFGMDYGMYARDLEG